MNYLVIDLEMCRVPKDYRSKNYKYANEIIQVGAVLLDEEYKPVDTLCRYVHPEYGVIDHFIANLTGIQNHQVKHAPKLKEVLIHMLDWLGDKEYQIFAWSDSDHAQIQHEIISKNIEDMRIQKFMDPERWIDYQDVFGQRFHFERIVSLEEALMLCNIIPDGRLHNGLDDALNTGKIIEKLEKNPEYQLVYQTQQVKGDSEPLFTCLGDLFAGLNIQFA